MWHFYCLPGRLITEIGYLFPKPGQISASKRRRESGFAAFLFATMFWALALPFLLPLVVGIAALIIHGLGTIAWPVHSSDKSQPIAQSGSETSGPSTDAAPFAQRAGATSGPSTPTLPINRELQPLREALKPGTVFAPHHEVVQPVDVPTGPATQACSATVTDHCIER